MFDSRRFLSVLRAVLQMLDSAKAKPIEPFEEFVTGFDRIDLTT